MYFISDTRLRMVGDAVRCTLRMNECPYDKNIPIVLYIQISKEYGNQGGNTGNCSSLFGMGFFALSYKAFFIFNSIGVYKYN